MHNHIPHKRNYFTNISKVALYNKLKVMVKLIAFKRLFNYILYCINVKYNLNEIYLSSVVV